MDEGKGTGTGGREVDPVCGMTVDPATAAGRSDLDGKSYFFCSAWCKKTFEADPGRFAGAGVSTQLAMPKPKTFAGKGRALTVLPMGPAATHADPQRYLQAAGGPPAPAAASPGAVYVCPMDPEV